MFIKLVEIYKRLSDLIGITAPECKQTRQNESEHSNKRNQLFISMNLKLESFERIPAPASKGWRIMYGILLSLLSFRGFTYILIFGDEHDTITWHIVATTAL